MRVVWLVSCRAYEIHEDDTVNIQGAGVNTIWTDWLPVDVELLALIRLALFEDEEGEIETHLLGPGMTPLGSHEISVRADPLAGHTPGFEVHMTQPLEFRFEATEQGTHSVELYLHDKRHESLFWEVKIGEPPFSGGWLT